MARIGGPSVSDAPSPRQFMAGIVARRESGVALVLVALLAGVGLTNPAFVSPGSVSSMLGDCAPAVIVVCGITLVILVG